MNMRQTTHTIIICSMLFSLKVTGAHSRYKKGPPLTTPAITENSAGGRLSKSAQAGVAGAELTKQRATLRPKP